MSTLHEKYKNEFSIIAVNGYNDNRESISTYAQNQKLSHPILLNGKSVSDDLYHVGAYPTTFWVDAEGTIIDYEVGAASIKRLEDRISNLLKR